MVRVNALKLLSSPRLLPALAVRLNPSRPLIMAPKRLVRSPAVIDSEPALSHWPWLSALSVVIRFKLAALLDVPSAR